jgi:hypothetical protein
MIVFPFLPFHLFLPRMSLFCLYFLHCLSVLTQPQNKTTFDQARLCLTAQQNFSCLLCCDTCKNNRLHSGNATMCLHRLTKSTSLFTQRNSFISCLCMYCFSSPSIRPFFHKQTLIKSHYRLIKISLTCLLFQTIYPSIRESS